MVGLGQVDLRNHLQLMVGPDLENLFLYERMRKENRSGGSGGKQREINLTSENQSFLTKLASDSRYSFDTICHTLVLKNETNVSIRLHRMCKLHV
jgi:hypothetical protein